MGEKPRGLITLFLLNPADTATESYIIVIAITLGSILGLLLLIVIATVLGTCIRIRLRVRASRRKHEDTGEIYCCMNCKDVKHLKKNVVSV